MSDNDLDKIHEQSSAILEKLYNEKGQPGELDEAFAQEFFDQVQESLNLPVDSDARRPQPSGAKLFELSGGLIEVFLHFAVKKFVVSRLNEVKILQGRSISFGVNEGKGRYRMSVVGQRLKFPLIVIKSQSGGFVIFIGSPDLVKDEQGQGEWEILPQ